MGPFQIIKIIGDAGSLFGAVIDPLSDADVQVVERIRAGKQPEAGAIKLPVEAQMVKQVLREDGVTIFVALG